MTKYMAASLKLLYQVWCSSSWKPSMLYDSSRDDSGGGYVHMTPRPSSRMRSSAMGTSSSASGSSRRVRNAQP